MWIAVRLTSAIFNSQLKPQISTFRHLAATPQERHIYRDDTADRKFIGVNPFTSRNDAG
jgi:hypothetical protein